MGPNKSAFGTPKRKPREFSKSNLRSRYIRRIERGLRMDPEGDTYDSNLTFDDTDFTYTYTYDFDDTDFKNK